MNKQQEKMGFRDYFINVFKYNTRIKENAPKVLVVDDDELSINSLLSILIERAAEITIVKNGAAMIGKLSKHHYDLIVVDRMMPGLSGESALWLADGRFLGTEKTDVVFYSGRSDEITLLPMTQFEVKDVWNKQLPYYTLQKKVNALLNSHARS